MLLKAVRKVWQRTPYTNQFRQEFKRPRVDNQPFATSKESLLAESGMNATRQ
ncbi:hypothetical protein DPMN_036172 [Dreissena polymorpha]|uniref:Uncharacterized protein n=1 Tax=Dreissena polymorpha TaxID=45954 RepID=A0A9D4MC27_DREPO|nr:hypothetical protein DPMN_036172 [Dreissena polymorpha]